jgi:hypothetical protein
MKPRIRVDFNTMMMDEKQRVYIGRENSPQDDQQLLKSLHQDSWVILYDEEMEVDASIDIVEVRESYKAWLGRPDWSTRRDLEDNS